MRYRLVHVSVGANIRGEEMRRLTFQPMPSEAFGMINNDGDGSKPDPQVLGSIDQLVTIDAAADKQVGDEFDVIFRKRDRG